MGAFFISHNAVTRKSKKLDDYKLHTLTKKNIYSFARKLSALTLVPIAAVCLLFAVLRGAAPIGIDVLLEYFEEQWLNQWPPLHGTFLDSMG